MNAPPAPFINLSVLPLTAAPSSYRTADSGDGQPPVITDLGGARLFTYSEEQAAALEAAFAQARRLHREGGPR